MSALSVSISAETLKGQDGKLNGQVAIGLRVNGRNWERIAGGFTITIPANKPTAVSVMIQVTDVGLPLCKIPALGMGSLGCSLLLESNAVWPN